MAQPASSTRLTTPSEQERSQYYYGLPSQPKLVARSNFHEMPWAPIVQGQHLLRKRITNIGSGHPLVTKYNADLQHRLIGVLSSTKWTSIDVVRIGYDDDNKDQKPVVLWVAVEPESLDPGLGLQLAEQCRAALSHAGVENVHCEIREATVTTSVVNSHSRPLIPLKQCGLGSTRYLTLTPTLGQSVAAEKTPGKEGTLGLYLCIGDPKVEGQRVKCALISHHVAYDDDQDSCMRVAQNGKPQTRIMVPGDATLKKIVDEVTATVAFWSEHSSPDSANALHKAQRLQAHLSTLSTKSSRCIGPVIYSPARMPEKIPGMAASDDDGEVQWLPDYALVRLDGTRFGDSNQVFLGTLGDDVVNKLNHGFLNHYFTPPSDGILRLRQTVPLEEITSPVAKNMYTDEYLLRVGKRGRSTGLT
ncbi:uncharacterized protein BCR38DRAFT_490674 [Pseudomassariella vexata]|uniref:Uncharacterized protein n=1 Tax=Pseudomassariella vexata TaxID=1141098 RepID=A0A1Y2DB46_9PEZI|nr:uncharacterized protein BCR38DRAFT_490674 [Pseudomassariella vexata]ORY56374.1 hypothetical protein BCR38DRAFT_490674 [Pseudomassariella vexata]